jgi:two-component system cell cycle sensor histidine kinase/response regulator CckA
MNLSKHRFSEYARLVGMEADNGWIGKIKRRLGLGTSLPGECSPAPLPHQTQALLNAIHQAYPGTHVRLDRHGVVLAGGTGGTDDLNFSELPLGSNVFDQTPCDCRESLREAFGLALLSGEVQQVESGTNLDGQTTDCSACLVPVGNDEIYMFALDGSERKRQEEERRVLEHRLRHVYRMEALGQLAGGLAHDFNNLLTVITGHAQILRSRLEEELEGETGAVSHLDKIQGASDGAASLTRVLLEFSRTSVVHPEWIDINQTLSHLQRYLGRLLREDVELVLELEAGVSHVWADPGSIEQLFVSLADHAAEAMPRGGRFSINTSKTRLELSDRREGEVFAPGDYVLVSLRDTGVGMTPEAEEKAFDFPLNNQAIGRGKGLGLASVFGTMEQVSGLLRMKTMEGVGTIFSLFFPAFRTPVMGVGERALRPQGSGLPGSETLLLCDDNEDVRGIMREALVSAGYQVLVADSAAQALLLEDSNDEVLHMLVTDLIMPSTTGAELANTLRERRPGLRVLFVTGYPAEVIENHTALGEDDALLPKPFTPGDLLEQVRELLDRRNSKFRQ